MSARSARRMTPATVLALSLLAVALACLAVVLVQKVLIAPGDPWRGHSLYVYPDSSAAVALAGADSPDEVAAFSVIAETPSAVWVEPEEHGVDDVDGFVRAIAESADSLSQTAVFVVYGIPNRDCGNESRGGLDEDQYPAWVSAIADGIAGTGSVVILEPDSLALASQCGNLDKRIPEISNAVDAFAGSEVTLYLDGGHSDWLSPETMADILNRAGIDRVRGFATNVSNYNSTDDEVTYANRLSELTGGSRYVIDISRNGNGSNGQWCNPTDRRLGDAPLINADDSLLDADLWIKNPGESDGTCGGGPPAGQWWADSALELASVP